MFDLTNRESFNHGHRWLKEIKSNAGNIPVLMIGNKVDLTNAIYVSQIEAEQFARKSDIIYIAGSALSGAGLGDLFAVPSCIIIGIPIPDKIFQDYTYLEAKP